MKNTITMLSLIIGAGLFAQSPGDTASISMEDIRQAYQQLEYARTVDMTEQYLGSHQRAPKEDLLTILQYRAFSQVALGNEDAAKRTLRSVLVSEPNFELDRQVASPKVIEIFENLKSGTQKIEQLPKTSPQVVIAEDLQVRAMLRSIVFPGLGQLYLDKPRGYAYASVAAASLGLTVYSAVLVPGLHDDYLQATSPAVIEDKYDEYNQWYHIRNSAAVIYAVNWGLSLTDILIFGDQHSPTFSLLPGQDGLRLNMSYSW